MKGQILTLFGLEDLPEQPAAKTRERKEKKESSASIAAGTDLPIAADPENALESVPSTDEPINNRSIISKDWDGKKKYYSIGEVAVFFNVKTSNIRFWTNEFKIKVRTNRKGDRMYTPEQVRELRAIYHLVKERGFTLAGAKSKLSKDKNKDTELIDLKQYLESLKNKLLIIRGKMN